jgi:hypothetical protein
MLLPTHLPVPGPKLKLPPRHRKASAASPPEGKLKRAS